MGLALGVEVVRQAHYAGEPVAVIVEAVVGVEADDRVGGRKVAVGQGEEVAGELWRVAEDSSAEAESVTDAFLGRLFAYWSSTLASTTAEPASSMGPTPRA